ncbi:hypothetical protein F2P81_000680 [Scophthalmus maximus]|uniref:Uncharacterized protein n=1 Tax=Scophthalmus maximus TaxID=52904 RepID=A0A6A4TJQ3_SCOMX|nr:hypothetical protein F2P81_000680 [Scophthalmus maximus]
MKLSTHRISLYLCIFISILIPCICPSLSPNDCASATEELCRQPGAVIESFVNHSPGVFSGTFSGEERRPLGSSTEEDHTLHCKLEHLQSLMHQRRLRRRTRRNSQTSRPYQHCQHQP